MTKFTSKSEVVIDAPSTKVWQALTDPAMVKLWLFGTEMTADWKVGGQIRYKGVWEGKPYEDKGEVLELVPNEKLVTTYWSGFAGLPDEPQNYQKVSYLLNEVPGGTKLVLIQEFTYS